MKKIIFLVLMFFAFKVSAQTPSYNNCDTCRLGKPISSVNIPDKLYLHSLPKGNISIRTDGKLIHNDTIYAVSVTGGYARKDSTFNINKNLYDVQNKVTSRKNLGTLDSATNKLLINKINGKLDSALNKYLINQIPGKVDSNHLFGLVLPNYQLLSDKGIANGYASLDGGGKVPLSQLPANLLVYKGQWNPVTNSPTLSDGTGTLGWVYEASVDGDINLGSGILHFLQGDFAIYNGTAWQLSAGTNRVTSVNSQQGIVVLNTDNISEGATNKYYTNARAITSLLTGYASAPGTISSSDNILQGIQKLNGNIGALSGVYQPLEDQRLSTTNRPSFLSAGVTATDGTGVFTLASQTANIPSAPVSGAKLFFGSNGLGWITGNGFYRTFSGAALTASRAYSLPDANGTFPLLESAQVWSGGSNTFNNGILGNTNNSSPTLTATLQTSGGTITAGTYFYKIITFDRIGNIAGISNEVTGTITSGQYFTLSWTASNGASSYRLYRYTSSGATTGNYAVFGALTVNDSNNSTLTLSGSIASAITSKTAALASINGTPNYINNQLYVSSGANATSNSQTITGVSIDAYMSGTGFTGTTGIALDITGAVSANATYAALRVNGNIIKISGLSINIGENGNMFNNIYATGFQAVNVNGMGTGGKLLLQGGGTAGTVQTLDILGSGLTNTASTLTTSVPVFSFTGNTFGTTNGVLVAPNMRATSNSQTMVGLRVAPVFQSGGVLTLSSPTVTTGLVNGSFGNKVATGGTGTNLLINITISGNTLTSYAPVTNFAGNGYTIGDIVTISSVALSAGGTTNISFTVSAIGYTGLANISAQFDNGAIGIGTAPATASNLTQVLTRNPSTGLIESTNGSSNVQSVSGVTNRTTSTGGVNPVIDINSTFEALFPKLSTTNTYLGSNIYNMQSFHKGGIQANQPIYIRTKFPMGTVNGAIGFQDSVSSYTSYILAPDAASTNVTVKIPTDKSGTMALVSDINSFIIGTPTIVAGTGAGTSPAISVTTNGKQLQVTLTVGTLPLGTNAVVGTITLANALSYTPYPGLFGSNNTASLLSGATMCYATSTGPSNITITSGTTALPAGTYIWNITL